MSTIYSSYRDVSGILTPGFAWGVLLVAPISGIFLLAGAALAIAYTVAGSVHPRLGEKRLVAAE
jgi:ACDE family multidrug resistance protein